MIPKIFKISGYLIDPTGRLEPHHIKAKMLYGCGFPLVGQHIHVQKAEIKKLDEKHPIMKENCDLAECEKYFNNEPLTVSNRKVEPGQVYRHFKGKTVKVLYIAQDSEIPGQFKVVYECSGGVWCRPYGMFVSKVDRKKYPDVKQKYRFELVEE